MKRLIIILILLPLLSSTAVFAQSAKQYFRAGEDFYKSANFNDAIDQYNKAIGLDPDYEKAYVRRAMAYSKTGDHVNAAADFDRALVFNEKDASLFYYSGHEWYLQGNYQESHTRLSKAISMKGNFLEAYQVRTLVNMELGRYDQALEDCQKCLRLKEDETGYFNLAQVYEKLAMYDDAEQAYLKSISKNSRLVEPHYALAHLQFERNKYNAASSSVRQVLQRDPKHLDGILLQSRILSAQGNYPKAVEVLSMASIEYPEEAQIFQIRGGIYVLMNQAAYSIIDFSKAIELNPNDANIYYQRAGAYESIRDFEKALADYEKILAMSRFDGTAQRLHEQATVRMFELNRESNKPTVSLKEPSSSHGTTLDIPKDLLMINLIGIVEDESPLESLQVNGFSVPWEMTEEGYQFLASVNLNNADKITVQVMDVYQNAETAIFPIRRTEVDPPAVQMIAPYSSENNILYLDNNDPYISLEGRISDESKIKSITVETAQASYIPSDLNPSFTALVNVENKSRITVQVEENA